MPAGAGAGRPAIYVSYDDAKAYVDWLREKSGKAYRLLSESEWEFAARGGTNTPFAGGESLAPTQANFDASTAAGSKKQGSYEGKSVDVGTFPPNPYGLHDMEGNVFEWVEDCWNQTHAGAPADASPRGGDCKRRVAKGGAWYYEAEFARPSARMSFPKGCAPQRHRLPRRAAAGVGQLRAPRHARLDRAIAVSPASLLLDAASRA